MNTLEIQEHSLDNMADAREFIRMSKTLIEKISDYAPSDNNVFLTIEKRGLNFVAKLKVSSQSLAVDCREIARSPFMAIETVAKIAMDQIKTWSASRSQSAIAGHES